MRIHMESKSSRLPPHLLGSIVEQLQKLNTPEEDILEARVLLMQQGRRNAARVQFRLGGKSIQTTQRAETQDEAFGAALQVAQQQLHDFRMAQRA